MKNVSQSLATISKFFDSKQFENDFVFLNKFNYSDIEKSISDLNGNITQLNSNNICISQDNEGYLLSYPKLVSYGYKDYRSQGMNLKILKTKNDVIDYIKHNQELDVTLSCLYSNVDARKIKSLMVDNVENLNEPKKNNGFTKTLGNKVKELRSVYLQKENINKPMI